MIMTGDTLPNVTTVGTSFCADVNICKQKQPMKPSPMPSKREFIWWLYASGSSTVAIDNKIEQAMDLVKSHLMFAVREEVEVLKEKIMELTERISQLEKENTILRAAASQETLAKLPQVTSVSQVPKPTS